MLKQYSKIVIMEQQMLVMVNWLKAKDLWKRKLCYCLSLFFVVVYQRRPMVFIFTCAPGRRKQEFIFFRLILFNVLQHWHFTFNVLKFNFFSF